MIYHLVQHKTRQKESSLNFFAYSLLSSAPKQSCSHLDFSFWECSIVKPLTLSCLLFPPAFVIHHLSFEDIESQDCYAFPHVDTHPGPNVPPAGHCALWDIVEPCHRLHLHRGLKAWPGPAKWPAGDCHPGLLLLGRIKKRQYWPMKDYWSQLWRATRYGKNWKCKPSQTSWWVPLEPHNIMPSGCCATGERVHQNLSLLTINLSLLSYTQALCQPSLASTGWKDMLHKH